MAMSIQVIGKNIDVGEALRGYAADRIEGAIGKYVGGGVAGLVRIEKEGNRFRTHCSVSLRSGLSLQSHGEANDAYASADAAFERLEKRVRRYKRKLKSHHQQTPASPPPEPITPEHRANDYVLRPGEEEGESEVGESNPVVIAESQTLIRELPVSEAVMTMDLADLPILVFRNAGSGRINVVYQRRDGNIGWIDPLDDGAGARSSETDV